LVRDSPSTGCHQSNDYSTTCRNGTIREVAMPVPTDRENARPPAIKSDLVLTHGAGPGLVVLLHAAGSGPRALDRCARALAGPGWATVAPVFENDGRCLIDATADDPFDEAVTLATSLLETHAHRPRLIMGHSMGGLVALKAVLAGVPADALLLYEPIVLSLLDPADPEDAPALAWDAACIAAFRSGIEVGEPEAGVRRFIEAYGDLPWHAIPEPARAGLVARASDLLSEAEATNRAALPLDALARLSLPVLVIHGTRSPPVLDRMVRRLAALIPAAEVSIIADAGHMGPVTHARDVAEAISRWRSERWP
jgi:pimeloyl-ACP methyl ester carboxylesterase